MACENGHLPCVKILAENKADVNFVSARGLSGLMLACVKGHMEVVKFLTITAGANVLFKTHSTALSMACAGGHEKIVDHLISIEPNVCKDVMLALMNACGKGNVAIINKLIQGNAVTEETLRHQSPIGNTCLMEACQKGHIDVVITLLDRISSLQGEALHRQMSYVHQ
jgi:ankyrin repeat protein